MLSDMKVKVNLQWDLKKSMVCVHWNTGRNVRAENNEMIKEDI